MKIFVAYDGSRGADAALHDLYFAGLPAQSQCLVLSVADVWPPPDPGQEAQDSPLLESYRVSERLCELRETAILKLGQARLSADYAADLLRQMFPAWDVHSEAAADSPAWGILKRAEEWRADLIVMGSHGMSMLDRVLIGSVSQRVLMHAGCSVRIARGRTAIHEGTPRVVIGFDGSPDAEAALLAVAARQWIHGVDIRIVTAVDDRMITALAARLFNTRPWLTTESEDHEVWLSHMGEYAVEQLRWAGLKASFVFEHGEASRVLLKAAEQWRADCVVMGATGLRGLRRMLLGSVSSSVAAHALCSVEVVRPAQGS